MNDNDRIYTLQFTRTGLQRLLLAMDTAYLYSDSRTDEEAFADAAMRRIETMLHPKEPK